MKRILIITLALFATSSFTTAPAQASGSNECTGSDCSLNQTVRLTVLPGPLSVSGGEATATEKGFALNEVEVRDFRGSPFGWTATASVSGDLADVEGLTWETSCEAAPTTDDVVESSVKGESTDGIPLCRVTDEGTQGVGNGRFKAGVDFQATDGLDGVSGIITITIA